MVGIDGNAHAGSDGKTVVTNFHRVLQRQLQLPDNGERGLPVCPWQYHGKFIAAQTPQRVRLSQC